MNTTAPTPYSPSAELLRAARDRGCAVAALNFYNAETLRGIVEAAREASTSVILQTTEATIDYLQIGFVAAMARAAAHEIGVPVSLHLDHGRSEELAHRCLDAGYSSVMIDGSKLAFEENAKLTGRVVELARGYGASVEAELGYVPQTTEAESTPALTDPDDASRFVEATGVDALAVAIGTAHGFYRGEVRIDFERLERIREAVPGVALVLHGGSGVPDALLERAVACGIAKINFGTELKNAFTSAVKASLATSDDIDLRRTFAPAVAAVRDVAAAKIAICSRSHGEREAAL